MQCSAVMQNSMGFGAWNFGLQEYGDQWRQGRRLFHSGVHQGIVSKYHSVQIRNARTFLKQLRENSDDLHTSVRKCAPTSSSNHLAPRLNSSFRHVGSTIVDVVYGIENEGKDYLITIADETLRLFGQATVPGTFMVDLIPARKHCDNTLHVVEPGLTRAQSGFSRDGSPVHHSTLLRNALATLRRRCVKRP